MKTLKTLKNKVIKELEVHEHNESLTMSELSKLKLEEVYLLAKTLYYLENAEAYMAGDAIVKK